MRPSRHDYYIAIAYVVATRSTCLRRSVGCVLVDRQGRVLSTGYNGVAARQPHCNYIDSNGHHTFACEGAKSESGTNLNACNAIHAEQNALLQCKNVDGIYTAYCTTQPCITCTKLLLSTPCTQIIYAEPYPHKEAETMWRSAGRDIIRLNNSKSIFTSIIDKL